MSLNGFAVAAFGIVAASGLLERRAPQTTPFRAGVDLVEVIATVTDNRGRPVLDLHRDEFAVFEDGDRQSIETFDLVRSAGARGNTSRPEPVSTEPPPSAERLFVLLLDDIHVASQRAPRVKQIARQFLERQVRAGDRIAVIACSGQADMSEEFTSDKSAVLARIARFAGRPTAGIDAQEQIYNVQVVAGTIANVARRVADVHGRRITVLFVSEGFGYNIYDTLKPGSTDVVGAIEGAIAALGRTNAVLYAIDPRGLITSQGETIHRSGVTTDLRTANTPVPEPVRAGEVTKPGGDSFIRLSVESLRHLSEATGGFAIVDTNDFRQAFDRISRESTDYYVLGYYPRVRGAEGQVHHVTVTVSRPHVRVAARKTYVSGRPPAARPDAVMAPSAPRS